MNHNKNIDEICWCEVCETYRQDYYAASFDRVQRNKWRTKAGYFLLGLLVVAAFYQAGAVEQFYLNNTF